MLGVRPSESEVFRFLGAVEEEIPHYLVSGIVSAVTQNPLVGIQLHLAFHLAEDWQSPSVHQIILDSRGGGGPSVQTQPPPSSKPSRQARASAQGGKSGAPRGPRSRGSRHRRKSCPKGHYWSFKQKKCVKSKFR